MDNPKFWKIEKDLNSSMCIIRDGVGRLVGTMHERYFDQFQKLLDTHIESVKGDDEV